MTGGAGTCHAKASHAPAAGVSVPGAACTRRGVAPQEGTNALVNTVGHQHVVLLVLIGNDVAEVLAGRPHGCGAKILTARHHQQPQGHGSRHSLELREQPRL